VKVEPARNVRVVWVPADRIPAPSLEGGNHDGNTALAEGDADGAADGDLDGTNDGEGAAEAAPPTFDPEDGRRMAKPTTAITITAATAANGLMFPSM